LPFLNFYFLFSPLFLFSLYSPISFLGSVLIIGKGGGAETKEDACCC